MFIFPIGPKGSLALLSQSRFVLEIVNQASLYACVQREISVPTELALGHLRCRVTDMPPQPNSPSGRCLETRLSGRAVRRDPIGAVFTTVGSPRGDPSEEEPLRTPRDTSKPAPNALPWRRFPACVFPNPDGAPPSDGAEAIGLIIR